MKRHLLVIATRGYAEWGHIPDDEFCSQWGLNKDKDYEWFLEQDDVALLVLHGYKKGDYKVKEFDPAEFVKEAARDRRIQPIISEHQLITAAFFHHSIDGALKNVASPQAMLNSESAKVKAVKQALYDNLLFGIEVKIEKSYSSRGGLAVEELKRDILSSSLDVEQANQFVNAIEMAAAGRAIFVAKLRGIQSALVRLRLLLDVAKDNHVGPEIIEQIKEAVNDLMTEGEGSSGKFHHWLHFISNWKGENEKKATELLAFLEGILEEQTPEGIDPQRAEKVWNGLKASPRQIIFASQRDFKGICSDISCFSHAADVLLDVSEDLPHTLPQTRIKSKRRSHRKTGNE